MHTIEGLSESALLRSNDEGEAQTEAELKEREAHLAYCETQVPKAAERKAMLHARLAQLNRAAPLQLNNHQTQTCKLLDEGVLGDPPLEDFAQRFALLDGVRRFLELSIQRLVTYHLPLSQRAVLSAQLDVAKARAAMLDSKALLSMVRRHRLMKPLVAHELSVGLSGGVTESLLEASHKAHMDVLSLQDALRVFDANLEQMQVKLRIT